MWLLALHVVSLQWMKRHQLPSSDHIRKYGCLSLEEAGEHAKQIEAEAFSSASQHYEKEPSGDGRSAVQLYAKECSMLFLEVLKKGPQGRDPKQPESGGVKVARELLFDISKGQRAFIEAEEVEELFGSLKEPGNGFTKICFSNRSFGLGAARVAKPFLVALKGQLKAVDLSDFIAGRSEDEALEVMSIFSAALEGCNLRSLNLSDNALGEKGVRAFGALLKSQSQLEELYFMNDGISEEAARAVSELIPSTEKLKVLHFHNNMTGDEGALAISSIVKRSPILEDFRCSSMRIGSNGGVPLSEALESCVNLKKLDLRDNMFGVDTGIALSNALSKHANLTEVYLSYLNLEDDGAIAIFNVLKETAPSLRVLDMAGNDITAAAVPHLSACIVNKQHMTKLNFAENELKDEGAIQIAQALEEGHSELTEIDLSSNSISRAGARSLAQFVVQKPGFKLLNISGNFISEDGVDDVKEAFKNFPEMLASLEDNDPEGGDDEESEKEERDGEDSDDLGFKLKNLEVCEDDWFQTYGNRL